MTTSILESTKKVLGIPEDYDAFDTDILMHINTVFADLQQLGVGPVEGFMIEDADATWDTFLSDNRLNSVKTYIYLRVRLLFDPPGTSYLIESLRRQAEELAWRMNVTAEDKYYVNPFDEEEELVEP